MASLSRRKGLAVLGLTSAGVVASEVLLSRILSVCTWYGLAFLVLSIAMLGMTSGSLSALRAQKEGKPLAEWIARRLLMLSFGLVLVTAVLSSVPIIFALDMTALASALIVVTAATVPMAAGGGVIARLMAELPVPLGNAYAVDLVSAALGSLAPLVLLGPLSGPSALIAVGAVAAIAADLVAPKGSKSLPRLACALCLGLVLLTELTPFGLPLRYSKGKTRADDPPLYESWNPLSYVALAPFRSEPFPLWAPGTRFTPTPYPVAIARIDGDAGTCVYQYAPGNLSALKPLTLDATGIAHTLRPEGLACVMGVGGGRDIETALISGHDRVVGFEINPGMISMLRQVRDTSPILDDPRVSLVLGDARASLAKEDFPCRVLQASLVDTWAATTAGAFAHSEATLYTLEAWSLFLKRVEPDGVLTFSRWYLHDRPLETARLVSLAVAALLQRGVARPEEHLALVAGWPRIPGAANRDIAVATILVSPAPFSPMDVRKLDLKVEALGVQTLLEPGRRPDDPLLDRILFAPDLRALAAAGTPLGMDTSAPDDDRPFFFQALAPRAWMHPLELLRLHYGPMGGNVSAAIELFLAAVATTLVAAVLLGPTLLQAARDRDAPLPGRASVAYFGSLGAGFMLAEIGLVQRMHLVLGHPTYALVVVLAGLLLASGAGSALSERVAPTRRSVAMVALASAALLAVMPTAIIGPLARATLAAPFALRVAWTGACAGALGLLLGMLFPSGLRFTNRERATPVALAVGGASSVLGSVLAVVFSVGFGIPTTFLASAGLYALAAACGPARWRPAEPRL